MGADNKQPQLNAQQPAVTYLSPDVSARLKVLFDDYNKHAKAIDERNAQITWRKKAFISQNNVTRLIYTLEGRVDTKSVKSIFDLNDAYELEAQQKKLISEFVKEPDVTLVDLVRFAVLTSLVHVLHDDIWFLHHFEPGLRQFCKSHECRIGLEEMAGAFNALGVSPDLVGSQYLDGDTLAFIPDADIAIPYFFTRPHLIAESLGIRKTDRRIEARERLRALDVLSQFPEIPSDFVTTLWNIALDGKKAEKPLAAKCLNKLPETKDRLIELLTDSKQNIRLAVAEWLGDIGAADAVPAIRTALNEEKQDAVKAAMLNTLDVLGVKMDEFLNPDQMQKEAKEALARGIPPQASWFPFDKLPAVRWKETGQEVPADVIKWWILQSDTMSEPEPGSLIRRYASMLEKADAEALAQYVLASWIDYDTVPTHTYEEASQLAKADASKFAARLTPSELQQYEKELLDSYITRCANSAAKNKGMLAFVGACGSAELVPLVNSYLKKWFKLRNLQCRLLLKMLAWVEHDTAIQFLLSVSNKFRTKGIQEEATAIVEALAERKNWTVDELADRTIPMGGFDGNGEMALVYGPRTFTARITPDLEIAVFNADGQQMKSLPDAAKEDDGEMAKEAKKLLADAKKELKSILKIQKDRLYDGMCTQRTWKFVDWDAYLNNHPIIRYHCQRLVWIAQEEGKPDMTFRPLDDGTLTDHQDNEVKIAQDTVVRLAHYCNTNEEDRKAWFDHFASYEIEPLFPQFTNPIYTLPDDLKEETEIKDFEGHLLESVKLRGKATRLGYIRGGAEEGARFTRYTRQHPSLGLEVNIVFTGNSLPEENRIVALQSLAFYKKIENGKNDGSNLQEVPLEEVPPILLSECWNDMRSIAAEGSGYDPDWEKKTE